MASAPVCLVLVQLASAAQEPTAAALVQRPAPVHDLNYLATQAFLEPPTFEGGRTEFELGDVNGDGHVDIVSVGDHGSPHIGTDQHGIMVWRGDGTGGFALVMTGDLGYGGVALGDADGDGWMDVGYGVHHDYAAVDLGDQLLEVALGDGSGAAWTPWDDGLASAGETWGMFGTDFGDVDNDGDLDLGSNSFGCCAGAHVYLNGGDGSWTHSFGFLSGNSDMDFAFCDFTGDGQLDFVAANSSGVAWRGDGTGSFVAAEGNLGGGSTHYFGIAAGDVDGDGADEVAYRSGGQPRVWKWTPGDLWLDLSGGLAAAGSVQLTKLVDMDRDGRRDLVTFGDGVASVWRRLADGWDAPQSTVLPGGGSKTGKALAVGDLDHNGYPDLLVLQDEGGLFSGGGNELYALYETSAPAGLSPDLVEPGPGRTWRGGQVRFLEWTGAAPAADPGRVWVELSTSGPAGPWIGLASGLPNNGRAQVVVPGGIASDACHLRLTVVNASLAASAVGLGAFSILP